MPPNAALDRSYTSNRIIRPLSSLDPVTFKEFGDVVQNPKTHGGSPEGLKGVGANQGTATKWVDVTEMKDWYDSAASGKKAKVVMNMFVCRPRELEEENDGRSVFLVRILERHPYTPQTFIPMGMKEEDRYLVIVAPTLSISNKREDRANPYPAEPRRPNRSLKDRLLGARPNPFTNDYSPSTTPSNPSEQRRPPKGRGEPDLENLQAFVARGDQAVTYGPGTWHAPMVVLGKSEVEFVVVQYANGVAKDDCQEFEISEGKIAVDVAFSGCVDEVEASALGIMRAKL